MTQTPKLPGSRRRKPRLPVLLAFGRDENGSLVVFSLFIFVMMVLVGGMAVDFIRFENTRTRLQNTLDRAILAAADLNQTLPAKDVVLDYFDKADLSEYISEDDVIVEESTTYRTVTATATAELPSLFLNAIGIDTLAAPAAGSAEERISDLEISLVLDISGSMGSYSRISNMRTAARNFVDTIFTTSEDGKVSISVLPYSTQVNMSGLFLQNYSRSHAQSNSFCVDFDGSDFNSSSVSPTTVLKQTAELDPWKSYRSGQTPTTRVCRTGSSAEALVMSGNQTAIKDKISALTASGNTSIDIGVKWGTALLDPATQPIINSLSEAGSVAANFATRPAPYSDTQTMKILVVMTDGVNTSQYYMPDLYSSGPSGLFKDPDSGRISVPYENWVCDGGCGYQTWYYEIRGNTRAAEPYGDTSGDPALEMDWRDVWSEITVNYHAYMRYRAEGSSSVYYSWRNATRPKVSSSTKNARLDSICTAAKNQGILIFTIGFEVTDSSAVIMESCASSASNFFRVAGTEIDDAFASIATKVQSLRLIQ